MARRSAARARRAVVLAGVLAVHGGLLVLLDASRHRDTLPARPQQRVTLRLVASPQPAVRKPAGPVVVRERVANPLRAVPTVRAALTARPAPMRRADATPPSVAPPPDASPDRAIPTPVISAEPSPGAAAPAEPILDTEASRRAIRASARAPSITAEVARSAGGAPSPDPTARLGRAMQSAGRGDCMKGDHAGGGMGLLSLPFLAAALARGDCAR